MKTLRLEQSDSYLKSFHSQVIAVSRQTDANWVALAASAFYPKSGGQACDTGHLNGIRVSDVEKRDGLIWHNVGQGMLELSENVYGELDWLKRFQQMQRHTAQHLLSQAFLQTHSSFETRAVSFSSENSSIDLAGKPQAKDLHIAEQLANHIGYQAIRVEAFEVSEENLSHYPLRRPASISGTVRLVEIAGFDICACGGTHVKSTAETLPIKLLHSEHMRAGLTRVYFKAGLEALSDYQLKHELTHSLTQSFSTQLSSLAERIETVKEELRKSQHYSAELELRQARYLAEGLASCTTNQHIVSYVLEPKQEKLLNPLAEALLKTFRYVLLATKQAETVSLLFCRNANASYDMNKLLQAVLPLIAGRGGGRANRAQGGGSRVQGLSEALASAQQILSDQP